MRSNKRLSSPQPDVPREVTLLDYVLFWGCTALILTLLMFV